MCRTFTAQTAPVSETKAVKRNKIRRAVLWYAKKTKMLEILEEAFPASLKMADLLRYELHSILMITSSYSCRLQAVERAVAVFTLHVSNLSLIHI